MFYFLNYAHIFSGVIFITLVLPQIWRGKCYRAATALKNVEGCLKAQ
jgi:hypothetical protein